MFQHQHQLDDIPSAVDPDMACASAQARRTNPFSRPANHGNVTRCASGTPEAWPLLQYLLMGALQHISVKEFLVSARASVNDVSGS